MDTYKRAYRKLGNQGLFDSEERTSMLNALGNPLERLSETIDFEMFRETLEMGLYRERLTNAGAKPYDYVLMFKILVLQRMYNLSDEQTEYQIVDRTSFRDFLGLASGDKVPDARTIWAFREQLTRKALHDRLFADFDRFLREKNLIMSQGVIIDGSFVEVPRQRNTREENMAIKDGRGGELWNAEDDDAEEDKKRKANKKNSRTRVRVEHVFGYCELNLHGMFSRFIGFARNAARNTLTNLVYNVCRYEQIVRLGMN